MNNYIERKIKKNSFIFIKNGKVITDKKLLNQCKSIYIAPAYKNVKIYLGQKLLATGYDTAGRKQYIYSTAMKELREKKKLKQLKKISNHIDRLHRTIDNDLLHKDYSKKKLVALVLKIMELCNFRSGSTTYEKKYGSYGITTIHKKHVSFKKNGVQIKFIGKKGVENKCMICNKKVQELIKEIYKLSSNNNNYLFSIKKNNEIIHITKEDVNEYLEKFDITSKDLRTWNANIIFLKNFKKEITMMDNKIYNDKTEKQRLIIRKRMIKEAVIKTACALHNTPAVCKSSYIYKHMLLFLENNNKINKVFNDNTNIESNLKNFLHIF